MIIQVQAMTFFLRRLQKAEKDMSKGDAELDKANIAAMREAQKALVSIVDLKAAIAESEKIQRRELYSRQL